MYNRKFKVTHLLPDKGGKNINLGSQQGKVLAIFSGLAAPCTQSDLCHQGPKFMNYSTVCEHNSICDYPVQSKMLGPLAD